MLPRDTAWRVNEAEARKATQPRAKGFHAALASAQLEQELCGRAEQCCQRNKSLPEANWCVALCNIAVHSMRRLCL